MASQEMLSIEDVQDPIFTFISIVLEDEQVQVQIEESH